MRLIVALGLGGLAALGQAPWGYWYVTLLALAGAIYLIAAADNNRRAALIGWLAGIGYFSVALHWIYFPFQVDAATYGWMAPFAVLGMAAGLALFWALAAGLGRRVGAIAVGFVAAETLRGLILTGFPWAALGHIWIDTGWAHLSGWVGPIGLTMLSVGISGAMAGLFRWQSGLASAFSIVILGMVGVTGGYWQRNLPETVLSDTTIRLIQPNAPQDEKWDPQFAPMFFERQISYTAAPLRPDLIVWPETSIPYFLEMAGSAIDEIADAAEGVPVIAGIQRLDRPRFYNSAVLIGRGGLISGIYDKTHLVPFGEYIPFGEVLEQFGLRGLASNSGGGFSAGDGSVRDFTIPGIGDARLLICYEGIFAEEIGPLSHDHRLLLLITNDAWFGNNAGPRQHLAQARLRSIETGLPMVRVANTGISAMIDPHGRIVDQITMGQAGFLDVALPARGGVPLYARIGDRAALILVMCWFATAVALRRLRIDQSGSGA